MMIGSLPSSHKLKSGASVVKGMAPHKSTLLKQLQGVVDRGPAYMESLHLQTVIERLYGEMLERLRHLVKDGEAFRSPPHAPLMKEAGKGVAGSGQYIHQIGFCHFAVG